ncbi:hypothetical protein ABB02_00945 [Clostridiaceae bacterium JG1575]|nr:hypothetical protein ABB02_00945 [Clostridiaceae bacterium JG1575]
MKHLIRIYRLVQGRQPRYALWLCSAAVIGGVAPLLNILVPKYIVDELLGLPRVEVLGDWVLIYALGNLMVALILSFLDVRLLQGAELLHSELKMRLAEKSAGLTLAQMEEKSTLDLLEGSRFAMDSAYSLQQEMKRAGTSLVSFLGVSLIVVGYSPLLYLFLLGLAFLIAPILKSLRRLEEDSNQRSIPEDRAYTYCAHLAENFRYGKDLRLYQGVALVKNYAKEIMDRILRINHHYFTRQGSLLGLSATLLEGQSVLSAWILGRRMLEKALPVGSFVMLFGACRQMGRSLQDLMVSGNQIRICNLLFEPLCRFLDLAEQQAQMERPVDEEAATKALAAARRGHVDVRLENLSFTYPTDPRPVLENLSLRIPQGKRTALVGTNGAGKSTLVKLLCRLYEPSGGRILLNGVDVRDIPLADYQRIVAPAFQDFRLFPIRIDENITALPFSKQSPEILKTLRGIEMRMGLRELIEGLPLAEATYLSQEIDDQGILLSGGQGQKLILGRTLFQDRALLIMDEPTAALDPQSEEEIFQTMLDVSAQQTSLFISHRLSSTRYADHILVLDQGQLLEEGTHQELMRRSGLYRTLYQTQAKPYWALTETHQT